MKEALDPVVLGDADEELDRAYRRVVGAEEAPADITGPDPWAGWQTWMREEFEERVAARHA